ncbi:MAG: glutamate racemase [Desulfobacterales bacterium]
MMIGVFDSGIGGLTVVRELTRQLPGYDFVYFGDTARTPYGTKSPETVIEYALQDTAFLVEKGARLVVMACNTASSVATDHLRKQFDVPIFDVITPAVQRAATESKTGRIGVIGTRATVNSDIYPRKIGEIDPRIKVYSAPCPLLVPLVEEGWMKKPETTMIVKKYLHPLKVKQIDTLILGCTHYPLLAEIIQRKIGKHVRIIDSSIGVVRSVKDFLKDNPAIDSQMSRDGESHLFVSDVTAQFDRIARTTLKRNRTLENVKLMAS